MLKPGEGGGRGREAGVRRMDDRRSLQTDAVDDVDIGGRGRQRGTAEEEERGRRQGNRGRRRGLGRHGHACAHRAMCGGGGKGKRCMATRRSVLWPAHQARGPSPARGLGRSGPRHAGDGCGTSTCSSGANAHCCGQPPPLLWELEPKAVRDYDGSDSTYRTATATSSSRYSYFVPPRPLSHPELSLSGVRCQPELWSDCPPQYPEKIEGALKRYEKFIKVGGRGEGVGGWKGST